MARMVTRMDTHSCHVCHPVSPISVTSKPQVIPMFAMYVIHSPLRREPFMSVIPDHLDGAVIPGGCGTCNAEQRITQLEPGMWSIGIAHDDWCPTWQRIQTNRQTHP